MSAHLFADSMDDAARRATTTVRAPGSNEPRCAECGRPIDKDGRWYSDSTGQLVPFCAPCAEREFGSA